MITDDQIVFNAYGCNTCYTIGEGKQIGPDLKRVASRRDTEWLESWITNSLELIASGDNDVAALFKEFNNSPMYDYNFSQAENELFIRLFKINKKNTKQKEKSQKRNFFSLYIIFQSLIFALLRTVNNEKNKS